MERKAKISNRELMLAGLRRLRRPAQRQANWQFLSVYWSLRKRWRLFSLHILRSRHSLGAQARSSRESAHIVFLIFRSVGGSFLFAVLLVVASGLINLAFEKFANATAIFASRWPVLAAV
jgi:hypothetical protein